MQGLTLYALFKLNQPELVKSHCVNRDKEVNHCQASCYLARQLKQDKRQKDQPITPEKERIPFPLLINNPYGMNGLVNEDRHPLKPHHLAPLEGFVRDPLRPPA